MSLSLQISNHIRISTRDESYPLNEIVDPQETSISNLITSLFSCLEICPPSKKKVRFLRTIKVVLIHTRSEFEMEGISAQIYWNTQDYLTMKRELVKQLHLKANLQNIQQPLSLIKTFFLIKETFEETLKNTEINENLSSLSKTLLQTIKKTQNTNKIQLTTTRTQLNKKQTLIKTTKPLGLS